jgi:asparagine synthase (glutamine-hydrolysing)
MMHITPESLHEQLPLHHVESRIAVSADARLDNRDELMSALGTVSSPELADSSLILAAWHKWGKDCADRLVGEFAFVIWDARDRCLHCVTDPMGVRPLFYTELPGRYFAVASEVAALLSLGDSPAPLNNRRLAMLGVSAMSVYLEPEGTCFENIYRIPAASILSIDKFGKTTREYWRPDSHQRLNFKSDAECGEAFQDVFSKAVRARLRSAFPVAAMLSGGLDSSGIVAMASQLQARENKSLITLSSVPMPEAQGRVVDERDYIELFRATKNLEMHEVSAPGCGPFDDLDELVKTASLCSYSFQHFLYTAFVRAARAKHARVILDGHGGEFSASCVLRGYLSELLLVAKWKTLIRELRHFDEGRRVTLPTIKRHVLRPLLPYALLKLFNRHSRFKHLVEYPIRADFIQDVLGRDVDQIKDQIFRMLTEYPSHRKNMVQDVLQDRRDLRQRSHAGFVDYQQARFSYPYFDKRVLEFGLAVDGRFKHLDGGSRRLVRLGMEGLLPKAILNRTSKAPFSPDYNLRYEIEKSKAARMLKNYCAEGKLREIVAFDKVMSALEGTPVYRTENPMRVDYESQFLIPYAVYLCYFVNRFKNQA